MEKRLLSGMAVGCLSGKSLSQKCRKIQEDADGFFLESQGGHLPSFYSFLSSFCSLGFLFVMSENCGAIPATVIVPSPTQSEPCSTTTTPQPHPPQQRGNQYPQNWGYPNSNYHHGGYGSSASSSQHYGGPSRTQHPPPPPHQQQQYPYPPPPLDSTYPPPPPPPASMPQPPQGPMYYPSSQYSQFSHQPMQPPPPPPPSSPPPSSLIPPHHPLHLLHHLLLQFLHKPGHSNQGPSGKQQKPPVPPAPVKKSNGPPGRVETEEERRLRKKREFEKQRQEEKQKHQLKESQNTVLQKTQMLSSGKGHGFRNELPDPTAQPKLMALKTDKDRSREQKFCPVKGGCTKNCPRFTKYTITSLEKMHKPQLFVEPDLGIPLDLLDLSVYNPPSVRRPLDPEDEELLRDDESVTPVKKEGIKKKERPTDKGVSWLVKTQYISPLSTGINKAGKEKFRTLRQLLQHQRITPVHSTNKSLKPVEILPLAS
ncbi:Protein PAF1-like [Vitis vinifera]|uniref:Protein PAF1-like n=1 Tax=Vitis vinifera TaxID=29760 RepID=A0A438CZ94_VITVI|nr:Protein PAF1-like [Vitis vinifera]